MESLSKSYKGVSFDIEAEMGEFPENLTVRKDVLVSCRNIYGHP